MSEAQLARAAIERLIRLPRLVPVGVRWCLTSAERAWAPERASLRVRG